MPRALWRAGSAAAVVLLVVSCAVSCAGGPRYPSCDEDGQCNGDGHKGVCVDHKCVRCRDDAACGKGEECRRGSCEPREAEKAAAAASKPFVECDDDTPCKGAGEKCQNGHCVGPEPGGPGCRDFAAPRFDFDSPELAAEAKQTLQRLAGCMTKGSLAGRKVLLTGHCDARGENEHNMGLGAERSERARTFLTSLGVPADRVMTSSRGKLDAVGTDEAGWAKDRRVDIEVR